MLRGLVGLSPAPGPRLAIALRAALSMAVPFGVLTLLGHEAVGLQTTAGAFTALFAAGMGAAERAKVLPFVAAGIIVSAAIGAALVPWPVASHIVLVLVAVVSSALVHAFRLGPPGPIFFVLVYGLAGNITAISEGERLNDPLVLLAAVGGGALFSYLVALSPLLRRAERRRAVRPLSELLPGPWLGRGEQTLVVRTACVALVGTAISVLWLDSSHAYWTVASGVAVIGLSADPAFSPLRGLQRMVGTLIGTGLFMLLAPLGQHPWVLIALLVLLQFGIEMVIVRNYALALVLVTPLVLLITSAASGGGDVSAAVLERLIDTLAGAALAVASTLLHRRPR